MRLMINILLRLTGVGLCACLVAPSLAQDASEAPADPLASLRAEIGARSLYSPHRPIHLRFTLTNTGDAPVEIPLPQPVKTNGGIMLPLQIVLGSTEQPALQIAYDEEKATAVSTDAVPEPVENGTQSLRLAPSGSVGAEVEFREIHRAVRYTGSYRLEWRPFGERIPAATVTFRVEARKDAILVTDFGKITFALAYDKAPRNVENFLELVRDGFYDGKTIHRVIPGFIIQGGCPQGDGTGTRPDGKLITAEMNDMPFDAGTLAMAHKPEEPNTASCQFFITLGRFEELDGKYTVIGQASDEASLRTLRQIAEVPLGKNDAPVRPVVIRSINLVDADQAGTVRRELTQP